MSTVNQPGSTAAPSTPTVVGGELQYSVVSVGDGDTFRARAGSDEPITVRLACTDAPETRQSFGPEASQRLKQLLPIDSTISLRPIDTDRYGRTVAEAIANGQSIGLQLIREGYAVAYRQYLSGCDADAYLRAEEEARSQGLQFWSQANPVMPWDFRHPKTPPEAAVEQVRSPLPQAQGAVSPEPSPAVAPEVRSPDLGNLPACVQSDCDCKDFVSQAEAQRVLAAYPGDPFRLDRDRDGIACESLK